MDNLLIEELRREERSLMDALHASLPFQRLQALRDLLALHDDPPVGALLDAMLPGGSPRMTMRATDPVIVLPGPHAEVA